jgi:TRAP-type C4-dicarboxylate transport system substrate-binding protein
MKNRRLLLLVSVVALVMALGLVAAVSGCGEESTTTTAAPTTATTAAPTDTTAAPTDTTAAPTDTTAASTETTVAEWTGEKIKLKYADQNAETGWVGKEAANPWLDQVEAATGNRVEIERFFGQTLMTGADTWEGLKAGIADLAWCMHQYWQNLTPLAEVMTLPFMPYDSGELGGAVMWTLYEEFPSIREQFADNHPVALWTSSPFYLLTVDKPVYKPEDMKGMKIRTLGGPPTAMMEAIGAVPVGMPMPDTYQALQTGVLDGILTNWESLYSFRHYEVGKYLTLVPFHTGLFGVSFNNNSWNGLPEEVKQQIESVSLKDGSMFWGRNMFDTAAVAVADIIKEKGFELEIITPTEEEIKTVWADVYGQPLWEEWVTKMEAAGHTDARAILDRALELIDMSTR